MEIKKDNNSNSDIESEKKVIKKSKTTSKRKTTKKKNTRRTKKKDETVMTRENQEYIVWIIWQTFPWLREEAEEEIKREEKRWQGRPRVITDVEVQKIRSCFSVGMKVKEMLFFCKIKKSSFYNYCKENPGFLEEIDYLKNSMTLQAKYNILAEIKKWSVADSWKRLEKVEADKFWNKIQVDNRNIMDKEQQDMYNKIVKNNKE